MVSLPPLNAATGRKTIKALPAVHAAALPRAHAMPSRRTMPKVVPVRNVQPVSAITSKPPLILSPQHCAEVIYANFMKKKCKWFC